MADTLRDLTNGTIGPPYRDPLHQGIGTLADLINAYSRAADHVGVTMPEWSPVLAGKSLTLRDLTTGDLGNVLEDISYGMGPMRGGNYATGGLGTYGAKPEAMELANAIPAGAVAGKVIASGARKLAPTAAEMLRKKSEAFMRNSGMTKEIIAGESARTADISALNRAKEMIDSGENEAKVLRHTGWFKGKDGRWRFVIPDKDLAMMTKSDPGEYDLNSLLSHPKLFDAYPDLASVKTSIVSGDAKPFEAVATYSPELDAISVLHGPNSLSSLLHEIQHAVQRREGFSTGASVSDPRYWDSYGEAEARKVQRMFEGIERSPLYYPMDPQFAVFTNK